MASLKVKGLLPCCTDPLLLFRKALLEAVKKLWDVSEHK